MLLQRRKDFSSLKKDNKHDNNKIFVILCKNPNRVEMIMNFLYFRQPPVPRARVLHQSKEGKKSDRITNSAYKKLQNISVFILSSFMVL